MEKHQCKLCSRFFNNGRALGGHMKAHMAVLPLPPKTHQQLAPAESTHSASSFSSSSEDEQQKGSHQQEEEDQKGLAYGLRENPKKSFRLADPEFSFQVDAGSVVIQDRESETESRNPTRRRSKRNRRMSFTENLEMKKPKLTTSTVDSPPAEPEPLSSVSDTSPEEDVAMCLMMLSRDVWMGANYGEADQEQNGKEVVVAVKDEEFEQLEEIKLKKTRGRFVFKAKKRLTMQLAVPVCSSAHFAARFLGPDKHLGVTKGLISQALRGTRRLSQKLKKFGKVS
ncbi:hypothetical protein ACLB2K_052448 [Fragaria x ananassa]